MATPVALVAIERERDVIQRIQGGDRAAAAELYHWYSEPIFARVIMPRLPVRELAEDVLKDTFVTVLETIGRYEFRGLSVYFWIRRIAINQAHSLYRHDARWQRISPTIPVEMVTGTPPIEPDRAIEHAESRQEIESVLATLNPRYARAIRLRHLDDLDRAECAAALGVRIGNFDLIYHRACAAYRKKARFHEDRR